MPIALFSHPTVGDLAIENGIDEANWGYNLNTKTFPTYGGEVVQILSVFIDDLTLKGSCSTYSQMEAIYAYFASYLQTATQGVSGVPNVPAGTSYNLVPMIFSYPERNWSFSLYPKTTPGFGYGWDTVLATWQMTAHINDTANDFTDIKQAIKDSAVADLLGKSGFTGINDQISPHSSNPETNPFQTFDQGAIAAQAATKADADYYASLIPAYSQHIFQSLTGGLGSSPTTGVNQNPSGQVTVPTAPSKKGTGNTNVPLPTHGSPNVPGGSKHPNWASLTLSSANYNALFNVTHVSGGSVTVGAIPHSVAQSLIDQGLTAAQVNDYVLFFGLYWIGHNSKAIATQAADLNGGNPIPSS